MTPMKKCAWAFAILIAIYSGIAFADGGRLRFSNVAGPFLVTLFTSPEPLTPGPADFSVMVQDAKSGDILSDAQVTLDLDDASGTVHGVATHGIAINRLLQAVAINLPNSGPWTLHLNIQQGTRSAALSAPIFVEPGSRQATLVWTFASLPVVAIILFSLHQRQKMHLARLRSASTTRKI
jgi:hypothetical protein